MLRSISAGLLVGVEEEFGYAYPSGLQDPSQTWKVASARIENTD
jgi:hypothetical protein